MIRIKICGLTRLDDAVWAAECGADALGFVLEPTSPRCVAGADGLLAGVRDLGPELVAVFGPAPAAFRDERFDAVQAIGPRPLGARRFIRCVRLGPGATVASVLDDAADADALLLDALVEGEYGGTGRRVDWGLAAEIAQASPIPVALAGGLTPENVAEAVAAVRPAGVDVSSGVEERPGVKSGDAVQRFIAAARSAGG